MNSDGQSFLRTVGGWEMHATPCVFCKVDPFLHVKQKKLSVPSLNTTNPPESSICSCHMTVTNMTQWNLLLTCKYISLYLSLSLSLSYLSLCVCIWKNIYICYIYIYMLWYLVWRIGALTIWTLYMDFFFIVIYTKGGVRETNSNFNVWISIHTTLNYHFLIGRCNQMMW